MSLGKKIKYARKNAGLTQEQMAEKLMISRPAITKWESDKGIPDIENLKAISKLLDVSLDYLLNDGADIDLNVIKEPIDIKMYGKEPFFFILLNMSVTSWHKNSSYGCPFNSTIGGLFFLLSVFTGLVQSFFG